MANEPFVFSMIYALISPFLKQKLRQRLKTVSNRYEEIYKLLDGKGNKENWKSRFPTTMGGKLDWREMTRKTKTNVVDHYKQFNCIFDT